MKNITGLSRRDVAALAQMILASDPQETWPPTFGLYEALVVTLAYLRKNRTQAELGQTYGTSQPTVSRQIAAVTPLIEQALAGFVPTADDVLVPNQTYVVDGTLLTCWSWREHPRLYSGKHKTTGLNVQVVTNLCGTVVWVSDPQDGCRHDTWCLDASGALGATRSLPRYPKSLPAGTADRIAPFANTGFDRRVPWLD